ncbi:hypothetical protein [Allokutzneria albata]|uniref:DUF333 domain-containing protein n=1 Tax=Allokutzneria albata TaxID=211114 RepID=A0A1G9Y5Q6_ALLAB|nr:hypothetical protein [Allokutzneria albata]SDN03805.1 hypothetical protein SAMN04489726_4587 [Allokutzneria albata]
MTDSIRRLAVFGAAAAAFASLGLVNTGVAQAANPQVWGLYPSQPKCVGEGRFQEGQLRIQGDWFCMLNQPVPGAWNLIARPR